MSFPKYPAGSLSIPKGPETRGHARQDVRRIRNGRHEIDREVLWRQIIARLDGGLVNEAMYYKLEQGRIAKLESQRKSLQAIKAKVEKAAKAKAALESVDGPIRWKKKKRIDFCGGWWKMKPRPTPSEPGFVVYTKELMQPDVPLTKREKAVGLLLGILASVLFGISIEIVKLLTYRYQNSIEMILFYQFTSLCTIFPIQDTSEPACPKCIFVVDLQQCSSHPSRLSSSTDTSPVDELGFGEDYWGMISTSITRGGP